MAKSMTKLTQKESSSIGEKRKRTPPVDKQSCACPFWLLPEGSETLIYPRERLEPACRWDVMLTTAELDTLLWRLKIRDYPRIHKSKYSIHPGFQKDVPRCGMNIIWWPNMKADIATLYLNEDRAKTRISCLNICERDGRFISNLLEIIQKALDTDISISTAYHPETDGQS
ncbi:hypothetical protein Tco_0970752 [Tanacetum coccineum]